MVSTMRGICALTPFNLGTRGIETMGMNQSFRLLLIAVMVSVLFGCEAETYTEMKSGDFDNAYTEEPLSDRSRRYANALDTSNHMVEKIRDGDYKDLYDNYLTDYAKSAISSGQFAKNLQDMKTVQGQLKEYKPSQWWFLAKISKGRPVLISNKLVMHEKQMVLYQFVFFDDGKYEKVVGLNFKVSLDGKPIRDGNL